MTTLTAPQHAIRPQPPARPLRIGPVTLQTNLLLAPIAGWCDLAWRTTVRELGGVGLACTDLLSPKGLLCGSEASYDLAKTNEHDKPIGMQLYGADPAALADAAKWCADHGATVVDINMGCPVDKVTKRNGGSMLMCDIPNAVAIAQAARKALPDHIPLTAKMRLGWDEPAYTAGCAPALAVQLTRVGVAAITVHGRTTEQRFKGHCRREGIARVVEAVANATAPYDPDNPDSVPVIGNGDVRTAHDASDMIRQTACAGVMIGRGAFARPWVFHEAWTLLSTGDLPPPIPESRKLQTVRDYFDRMIEHRGEHYALHKIRQKIAWLGKGINDSHCKPLKDAIRAAASPSEVHAAIDAWAANNP